MNFPPPNSPDTDFEKLWLKCPKKIGTGSSRDVFEIDGDYVLKVSNKPINFSNWSEIVIYTRALDKSFFAEVKSWSNSGKFMVMEKLQSIHASQLVGHRLPSCIFDKKTANFGMDKSGDIKLLDFASFDFNHNPLFTMPKP